MAPSPAHTELTGSPSALRQQPTPPCTAVLVLLLVPVPTTRRRDVSAASSRAGSHSSAGRLGPWRKARPGGSPDTQSARRVGPRRQGAPAIWEAWGQDSAARWEGPKGAVLPRAPTVLLPTDTPGSAMLLGHLQAQSFRPLRMGRRPGGSAPTTLHPAPYWASAIPGPFAPSLEVSYYQGGRWQSRGAWGWPPGGGGHSCWSPWSVDH